MRLKSMRRKQNLASALGIKKENWGCGGRGGIEAFFLEIIKLQFGKKSCYIFYCIFFLGYHQFSFGISIALDKICLPTIVINHSKILLF